MARVRSTTTRYNFYNKSFRLNRDLKPIILVLNISKQSSQSVLVLNISKQPSQ
jgi:hypothetical protein